VKSWTGFSYEDYSIVLFIPCAVDNQITQHSAQQNALYRISDILYYNVFLINPTIPKWIETCWMDYQDILIYEYLKYSRVHFVGLNTV
jgi:hypothetical protein